MSQQQPSLPKPNNKKKISRFCLLFTYYIAPCEEVSHLSSSLGKKPTVQSNFLWEDEKYKVLKEYEFGFPLGT